MAIINGKPLLEHILEQLVYEKFENAYLLVCYRKELVKNYFNDKFKNLNIFYSETNQYYGTGGSIKYAVKNFNSRFVSNNIF